MAGVWVFKDGGARLSERPKEAGRRTRLIYSPTNELVTSHEILEAKLRDHGWVPYALNDPELILFHQSPSSVLLICVPRDFSKVRSMHMYDIAVKTRHVFLKMKAYQLSSAWGPWNKPLSSGLYID
ncbi:flowering-promoting factor 1-like protein 4 [Wolffia australiana]